MSLNIGESYVRDVIASTPILMRNSRPSEEHMVWRKMGPVRPGIFRLWLIKIRIYRDSNHRLRWALNVPRWLRVKRIKD